MNKKESIREGIKSVRWDKRWWLIGLQLGLISLVIEFFDIEADLGFSNFWPLVLGAFFVHAIVPRSYRKLVLFVSFVAILSYLIGERGAGKILIGGFFIIGLCHLPIPLLFRKILVFALGIVVMMMTLNYLPSPMTTGQMRIFATMFMFRIILYLYELEYEKERVSLLTRLNYFFMLPNMIFPLFPIVDYKGFQKSYYNQGSLKIYQSGTNLILWSLVFLLIYRFIYQFGIPALTGLEGVHDVAYYMISTYLTVIRLVGLLCISVGILRLFGYNLPEIFKNLFLASSFVDLFRRINIYWKAFLTKVCYYPVYFKLRKKTPEYVVIISVLITFFFTWVFHIYQWFWVLGTNPIRENSIIFWGTFGILATINTIWEGKPNKETGELSLKHTSIHTAKIIGTFLTMSALYTMWISPSFDAWLRLILVALSDSTYNWMLFGIEVLAVWAIISAAYFLNLKSGKIHTIISIPKLSAWAPFMLLLLLTVSVYSQQGNYEILLSFKLNNELNERDDEQEFEGYYDEILKVRPDVATKLWTGYREQTKEERFKDMDFVRQVNTVMLNEFIPNSKGEYKNKEVSANRWGFRDKDYDLEPSDETVRIAIVGSSPTMGSGVADSEVFEQIVEDRLNEVFGNDTLNFELLNFAKPSIAIFHHAYLLEEKIRFFKPDYILDIEHCRPFLGNITKLQRIVDANVPIYPELDALLKEENIKVSRIRTDAEKNAKGKVMAKWGYKHFRQLCREYDIQPIWVFLPAVSKDNFLDEYLPLAKEAGFEDIISLEGIYRNYHQSLLQVGKNDRHPNALGHQVIAKALYERLVDYLGLDKALEKQEVNVNE